jgi:hypothetical protein
MDFPKSWFDKVEHYKANKIKPAPGMKFVTPELGNFYTGIKPTKATTALGMIGIAAWAVGAGAYQATGGRGVAAARNNAEDLGNLSALSYDAVGNIYKGRRDLGATGDIVFGLHNSRRGG